MGGWAEFFELLAGEDIDGDEMDLGVAMLASLGGRHIDDLARAVLDHDEAILSQGRALHGKSGRGTGICRIERMLMLEDRQLALVLYGDGNNIVWLWWASNKYLDAPTVWSAMVGRVCAEVRGVLDKILQSCSLGTYLGIVVVRHFE